MYNNHLYIRVSLCTHVLLLCVCICVLYVCICVYSCSICINHNGPAYYAYFLPIMLCSITQILTYYAQYTYVKDLCLKFHCF